MPRQLADVLHHLLPDAPPEPSGGLISVPLEEQDLVRAALCWNLAVELARHGEAVRITAPPAYPLASLRGEAGPGPLGVSLDEVEARDLCTLTRAGPGPAGSKSLTFALHPPAWIEESGPEALAPGWVLALVRPGDAERKRAADLLACAHRAWPRATLGASVHGVRSIREARETFEALAACMEALGAGPLQSYGLLVEDLDLCRSIVGRRPVGIAWPRSAAARALADVARLLRDDVRERDGD